MPSDQRDHNTPPDHGPTPEQKPGARVPASGRSSTTNAHGITIRDAVVDDAEHARRLFESGREHDHGGTDDPGDDIADFVSAYLENTDRHMWMATDTDGSVVGMIALAHHSDDLAELSRLRVDPAHRGRGIGSALVEHALGVCRERSYLKIILDTFVEREPAKRLFGRFGFRASAGDGAADTPGKRRQAFYLDLYRGQSAGQHDG